MKSFHPSHLRLPTLLLACAGLCVAVLGACSSEAVTADPAKVSGHAELTDRISAALTTATVTAIKGTYGAACTARTGTWTIALNAYGLVTGETALTVVTGDVGCILSVTEVKVGPGATALSYKPALPIPVAAAYAEHGVAFMLAGAGATQFYANFRLQPDLLFNADFILNMVYSDNVSEVDLSVLTNYQLVVSTATAAAVPAPNATMLLTALDVKVDAKSVVKTATGTLKVTQGAVIAEAYVIDLDTVGTAPTYAALDTAFNLPANTRVALTGASQTIPAADLKLVAVDLSTPKKRNVIVANTDNGVTSYQVFQITFSKP